MRGRLPRLLALPLTAAALLLPVVPAVAQDEPDLPTTPIPQPADPNQPPISAPIGPQPTGHAVGAAGTALGILRLLPESVPTDAILPGASDKLPKQAMFEAGLALTTARANSEAYLSYERSIAQASPGGIAVQGNAPQSPGTVVQTALPDNPEPRTSGFNAPPNPLLDAGLLNGKAHARWSPTLGPCVGTIADSSMSLASLSLLPEIPSLASIGELAQASDQLSKALGNVGPLATLGGLLPGKNTAANAQQDAPGGLISLPNTMSTRSTVRLVDMPGTENKAVQSISTMQMADVHLLQGTPFSFTIKVVSQPTLTVTSTGSAKTSSVEYTAPTLAIHRDEHEIYTLDAAHPTKGIPIGIPTDPTALADALGLPAEQLKNVPVIGGLVATTEGAIKALPKEAQDFVLDIGVIRLSIAELDKEERPMTKPFKGYQLGASARMLNVEILPTDGLKKLLPPEQQKKLPSSLAQLSFGEQISRAYAPTGGVTCGTIYPPGPPEGGGNAPGVPDQLAETSAAYATVPMFWTGTGLLLAGVVMVSALPGRRRPSETKPAKPSPRPRDL